MLSQSEKLLKKDTKKNLEKDIFSKANLPDSPGVYFFKDNNGKILYIGRATSLRDRIRSYFSNDLIQTRGPLIVDMVTKSQTITHEETDSVLEAIILENNLIKKHQPYFNTKEKDNRSYNYVVITDEDLPRVIIVRGRALGLQFKIKEKFGPYPNSSLLREALRIVRKIFPFRDAKAGISHQESFYRSIGLSPDIISLEEKREYKKTIRHISLFFQGKKSKLVFSLLKEMKEYAKKREFEKADKIKRTLYALTHIQDIALIKAEKDENREGFRIEAYDIAHMSGKNKVGVMVVSYDGEMDKNEYRKFKISKETNDDVGGIREILTRRFTHTEWQQPNLIVIDGGIAQRNTAQEVLNQIFKKEDSKETADIHIVSVVKNEKHRPDHFLGDENVILIHKDSILRANSEAHRFAIAYHRNLRKRTFLKPIY